MGRAGEVWRGRRVVLGVSGGIACYKAVEVCRRLVDAGAHVMPVMTEDARRFVGEVTFSALASEPARWSLWDGDEPIPHTRLGQRADLFIVAPATARVLGKYAAGISDDLLTASLLATRAPVVVAPAMHTEMWEHAAVQENLATLRRRGVIVVDPEHGRLAGGDEGEGRLAAPERILEVAGEVLARGGDLLGVRLLVTAGGTREPIDPVRFVGNRSSGKMGHALAAAARARGAAVTLVSTVAGSAPPGVPTIAVDTAAEMADAVLDRFEEVDVVVMAAAVADFRPVAAATEKIKKTEGPPSLTLEPTLDILAELGRRKGAQLLVGFAAETGRLTECATEKLERKCLDLVVGNDVTAPGSGFEVDTNRAVIVGAGGATEELPLLSKRELADVILDRVVAARAPDAEKRTSPLATKERQ